MRAAGLRPDQWQASLIRCPDRKMAALCTRRSGKTRTVGTKLLARCLTQRTKALIFSPTEDQSKEMLAYVKEMNAAVGCPVPTDAESETRILWRNGSEVKVKTDRPISSRGFTPTLLVIDEAAQVSDELYLSVLPMMIQGRCDLMVLSTPWGKQGWFHDAWHDEGQRWDRYKITADECPRIDREILEEHRAIMPSRWFRQEYYCEFNDAIDAVFGREVIESAVKDDPAFIPFDLGA